MILAAIVGGVSFSTLLVIFFWFYMKRRQRLHGYQRLKSELLDSSNARRASRAMSCFTVLPSGYSKAPVFSIPDTKPKTPPKGTCQLQCSLQYNFHTSMLKIQVVCAVNLPRLFGLQSGVLVKVQILASDGETVKEDLGNTAIQFRSKNPVFKDVFVTDTIPYEELKEMTLNLSLFSSDRFRQSHFVGDVSMKFADIHFSPLEPVIVWRPVQPKVRSHGERSVLIRHLLFNFKCK